MKIQNLKVSNFIGITEADLQITKKIALFIGQNNSGKSSLASTLEFLATGTARGLTLKKDRGRLIKRGCGKAEVVVTLEDNTVLRRTVTATSETFRAAVDGREISDFRFTLNPIALNPYLYFEKSVEERKAMLYRLVAGDSSNAAVAAKLIDKGLNKETAEEIAIQVNENGFSAVQAGIIEQRKAAKRERERLKDIQTPQESIRIEEADYMLSAYSVEQLTKALSALEEHKAELLIQKGKLSTAPERSKVQAELETVAAALAKVESEKLEDPAALKGKLKALDAEIKKINQDINAAAATKKLMAENLHLQAPDIGFELCPVMEGIKCPVPEKDRNKVKKVYEDKRRRAELATDEAIRTILALDNELQSKTDQREDLDNQIKQIEQAFTRAQSAISGYREKKTALEQQLQTAVDGVADTTKIDAELAEINLRITVGSKLVRAVEEYHAHKAGFDKAAPEIAARDEEIRFCDILDKALSPNGVPAELAKEAMGAFRSRLEHTGKIFGASVEINPDDYLPLWNGQHFNLLSESERWRAEFAVQEAIAFLAHTPWLVADRCDILDVHNRDRFFDVIFEIVKDYDFVALFATQNTETINVVDHAAVDFWRVHEGRVTLLKPDQAQAA